MHCVALLRCATLQLPPLGSVHRWPEIHVHRIVRAPLLATVLCVFAAAALTVGACRSEPRAAHDAGSTRTRRAFASIARAELVARAREVVRGTEARVAALAGRSPPRAAVVDAGVGRSGVAAGGVAAVVPVEVEDDEPLGALAPRDTEDVDPPPDALLDEVPASGAPLTRMGAPTRNRQGDRPHEGAQIPVFEAGRSSATLTHADAEARGLVIVDLRDVWVPFLLSPDAALGEQGQQPYVDTYRALAAQQFGEGEEFDRARSDRFLELYGITPTFAVLAARLADDERHTCHAAIDDAPLAAFDRALAPFGDAEGRARQAQQYRQLLAQLTRAEASFAAAQADAGTATAPATATATGTATVPATATATAMGTAPETATALALREPASLVSLRGRVAELRSKVGPVLAIQAHLRCEALLSARAVEGVYEPYTVAALGAYQRLHMVPSRSGFLDAATRAVLLEDSRELDFRAVLRALRERVVDATGLIEDGSAGASWGTVLGRTLDPVDFRAFADEPALENAAPDRISPATEAAARALGWTSFDATRAFFDAREQSAATLLVALRLPPAPSYHLPHMQLRAEIDRGDIWYDYPYTGTGRRIAQPVTRRARLVLYAQDGDRELALVRWPTTVGGWEAEQLPGGRVGLKYKNSDVGPRVWRDLIASPAWLPPPTTPDDDLIRRDTLRGWRVKRDAFGPGFASAYGLVMLVQHVVIEPRREGEVTRYFDRGIRTHGSASYSSILRGTSHGCHRLFNHLAIRLGGFLLAHRDHVRHGPEPVRYQRDFRAQGRGFSLRIDSRGVRTELVPPVAIRVLPGNVRGRVQTAPNGVRPLPSALVARARAAAGLVDE